MIRWSETITAFEFVFVEARAWLQDFLSNEE